MGILSFMGSMVGEQLYPVYENARSFDERSLVNIITDDTNKIPLRAVHLLALMQRSRSKACELYKEYKNRFDNAFNSIYNYRRFQPIINEFRRIVASTTSSY